MRDNIEHVFLGAAIETKLSANFSSVEDKIGMEEGAETIKSISKEEENVLGYHSNNVKKVRLNSTLTALLDDPILADVPKNPTLSDVDTLISLELGSAMRISVRKLDGTAIGTHTPLMFLLCLTFSQTLGV